MIQYHWYCIVFFEFLSNACLSNSAFLLFAIFVTLDFCYALRFRSLIIQLAPANLERFCFISKILLLLLVEPFWISIYNVIIIPISAIA